ncbi:hypothetical protein QVD17_14989 [Tagetes erecta]|uniref:Protein kinase domain-containing protein n=1 Tax=Tagetes erecta TaxID=13708 RepID=A0AAD8NYB2_TARER|nr:hypothetical protein QVD17_14989 [Tagetes erecta]
MSWGEYVDSWRICFEEVETATNNFADENLLKRGTSYDVYKGQLIDEQGHIHDIVARVSKNKIVSSHETVFSYHLDHKNMTSLFKVCVKDDVDQLIMLNKYEANESLDKHLSSPTLTWIQRLHICVGVAQALKYLHNDVWNGNYYLIHANIKSSKILLDHNWEPKLHGFGFSIFAKKHSIQRYTKYNGSPQHMDPAYEITRVLTQKSDVFSFGVVLFEVLFGTQAYVQNNDNWYFARLARSHYEDSKLDDLIHPDLRKQMNTESFNIFAKIAYYCLKEHRSQRPDMNQLLSKLEKALELQDKHEHPVTLATEIKATSSSNLLKEGLPSIARQCLNEGTLNNLIDPKILEDDESISLFSGGANQDSLDTFTKVAFQCLAKTQFERPTMEVVIKELTIALNFQKTYKNNLHISLEAIKSATKNFKDSNCIGEGRSWKLYEGEVVYANEFTPVIVKRWDRESPQRHTEFLVELDILLAFKHDNIITLVGYCKEMDENIIVYEHTSNGKLDKHLCDCSLTWMKRLKICIDVAKGLGFLHKGIGRFIHKDIRSSSILLDGDWNAKIFNFESTCGPGFINKLVQINDNDSSSLGYTNLEYEADGFITVEFDVYSLGVILTEMLCGRLAWLEGCVDHSQSLGPLFVRHYHENGDVHKMIFEAIKEQIAPQSLNTFQSITLQCLKYKYHDRPKAHDVVIQLEKALRFQEDYEIWEPKLPVDYIEIINMSKHSKINHSKTKQDLYDMFFKGIMLQDNKLVKNELEQTLETNSNKLSSPKEVNEKNYFILSAKEVLYDSSNEKHFHLKQSRFEDVIELQPRQVFRIKCKIQSAVVMERRSPSAC